MQRLLKISFFRNRLYARAVEEFTENLEEKGIILRNEDMIERLCAVKTLLIDARLIMEGNNSVRRIAAPLDICEMSELKRQGSWMVLTAGISLGCEGYAPLEKFAMQMSFARERMAKQYPLVDVIPYDDERRMETTIHRDAAGMRAFSKGEPSAVLDRCVCVLDGRERALTDRDKQHVLQSVAEMEAEGLSTLAFATKVKAEGENCEKSMVFLGVVGTGDLPNPDAPWAMEALRSAGVRPVLVASGDMTAGAVWASGVLRDDAGTMSGEEIDALNEANLRVAIGHADAFLGVDWKQKERLAKALRVDGTTATISPLPDSGGLVLSFSGGVEPDVVFETGGLRSLMRFLGDCRALQEAYVE